MGKKGKQRVRHGRPQSTTSRARVHKGPPPRPARKPAPPSSWQRFQSNRPLFFGAIGLAVAAVAIVGWLFLWGPLSGKEAAPTPTPTSAPTPTPTTAPTSTESGTPTAAATSLSWTEPPAMTIDPGKQYTATIVTDKGDITLELYADKAPKTVNSFVFLARQGYYDGVTFHRVLPDFMAQGGDPTGTGGGGPGYQFEDEIVPELQFDGEGILAMANAGANTNGSQFFITYVPTSWLNGKHTIFGRVVEGMDVARSLTPRNPEENPTFTGDRIQTIRITEG